MCRLDRVKRAAAYRKAGSGEIFRQGTGRILGTDPSAGDARDGSTAADGPTSRPSERHITTERWSPSTPGRTKRHCPECRLAETTVGSHGGHILLGNTCADVTGSAATSSPCCSKISARNVRCAAGGSRRTRRVRRRKTATWTGTLGLSSGQRTRRSEASIVAGTSTSS